MPPKKQVGSHPPIPPPPLIPLWSFCSQQSGVVPYYPPPPQNYSAPYPTNYTLQRSCQPTTPYDAPPVGQQQPKRAAQSTAGKNNGAKRRMGGIFDRFIGDCKQYEKSPLLITPAQMQASLEALLKTIETLLTDTCELWGSPNSERNFDFYIARVLNKISHLLQHAKPITLSSNQAITLVKFGFCFLNFIDVAERPTQGISNVFNAIVVMLNKRVIAPGSFANYANEISRLLVRFSEKINGGKSERPTQDIANIFSVIAVMLNKKAIVPEVLVDFAYGIPWLLVCFSEKIGEPGIEGPIQEIANVFNAIATMLLKGVIVPGSLINFVNKIPRLLQFFLEKTDRGKSEKFTRDISDLFNGISVMLNKGAIKPEVLVNFSDEIPSLLVFFSAKINEGKSERFMQDITSIFLLIAQFILIKNDQFSTSNTEISNFILSCLSKINEIPDAHFSNTPNCYFITFSQHLINFKKLGVIGDLAERQKTGVLKILGYYKPTQDSFYTSNCSLMVDGLKQLGFSLEEIPTAIYEKSVYATQPATINNTDNTAKNNTDNTSTNNTDNTSKQDRLISSIHDALTKLKITYKPIDPPEKPTVIMIEEIDGMRIDYCLDISLKADETSFSELLERVLEELDGKLDKVLAEHEPPNNPGSIRVNRLYLRYLSLMLFDDDNSNKSDWCEMDARENGNVAPLSPRWKLETFFSRKTTTLNPNGTQPVQSAQSGAATSSLPAAPR